MLGGSSRENEREEALLHLGRKCCFSLVSVNVQVGSWDV